MKNTKALDPPKYIYLISSRREYNELCAMEMRHIFGKTSSSNYHLTNSEIDVNRSPFIKGVVSILYKNASIEEIESMIKDDGMFVNNYKIHYHKIDDVPYQSRLHAMRILGTAIEGDFAIKNPVIEFILTKIDNEWIFGSLNKNSNSFKKRRKKPYSYSNSLDVVIAKAAINIVIENNFDVSLIDPCCGIGTVVIEGRFSSVDTVGYEINPLIKQKCNKNLEYYNMAPDVTKTDMRETTRKFDVAILDLPYGHHSSFTTKDQISLIKQTKVICNKALIITMEDMSAILKDCGYQIIDSCKIKKSNTFSRYVTLCS